MEKTVNIIIDDFRKGLIRCVEEAGLPAVVLLPYMKEVCTQLETVAANALAHDRQKQKEAEEKEKAEEEKGDEEDGVSS
ncbi:MAG: hypothetical protein KBS59_08120 [Clostridiales bacterium]|nr:hypothetical protein [Clostridiales bacterium]